MQPVSTVAPVLKKSTQLIKKDPVRVSDAQSKDIMNNLLGELDKNDDDDLQEIGQAVSGALDTLGAEALQEGGGQVAFNQQDKFNQKYNIAVNQIGSKKRTLDQISTTSAVNASATKPSGNRPNPFAKKANDDVQIVESEHVDHSLF